MRSTGVTAPLTVDLACGQVTFYAARYDQRLLGIFPVGDLTNCIPDAEADVAILEEPEHLTWFHHGTRWSSKFQHVVRTPSHMARTHQFAERTVMLESRCTLLRLDVAAAELQVHSDKMI